MTPQKNSLLIITFLMALNHAMITPIEQQPNTPSKLSHIDRFKKQAKEFIHRFIGKKQYRSEQIQQARAAVLIPAAILIGGGGLVYWQTHRERNGLPEAINNDASNHMGESPIIPPPPAPPVEAPGIAPEAPPSAAGDGDHLAIVAYPHPGAPAPGAPSAAIICQEIDRRLLGFISVFMFYLALLSHFG